MVKQFATAFLQAELKGDGDGAAALQVDRVAFPKMTVEVQGYQAAP